MDPIYDNLTPRFLLGCHAEAAPAAEPAGGLAPAPAPEGAPAAPVAPAGGEAKWFDGIEDEGLRGAVAGFESQNALLTAVGYKAPEAPAASDWREQITDEDARKFADSSTDPTDFAKRGLEMRQKLAKAIVPLGENASEEEIADYRAKTGVPKDASEYQFPAPPDGYELTDLDKAAQGEWAKRFHAHNVPKATAEALLADFYADQGRATQAIQAEDKRFASEAEDALKREWAGDYEKNDTLAQTAAQHALGTDFEEMSALTVSGDRLLLDHPSIKRMFARLGREGVGQEGRGVGGMNEQEIQATQDKITGLRQEAEKANAAGDHKRANQLYQQEQELLAKTGGSQPIVGSQGRAA